MNYNLNKQAVQELRQHLNRLEGDQKVMWRRVFLAEGTARLFLACSRMIRSVLRDEIRKIMSDNSCGTL